MGAGIELSPGAVVGRDFRVVRPLAEGGMGAVYVVDQLSTGARRALKVLHARFANDPTQRERFAREASASARVASDHVVEVVAAGVDEASGAPWMVMELLDGPTLAEALARKGTLSLDEAREVFSQLGHALASAHAVGIVHRDLKPENVVLATPRRAGALFRVKVLDFGIAKLLHEGAGANTQALGSPRWMAPEQTAPGAPIGPPTDVWAFGLLAYASLTGSPYWRNAQAGMSNPMALLVEIGAEPLAPASQRAAEQGRAGALPQGFDAWFARCVARPLASRFPSGAEATEALLALLQASQPGLAATAPQLAPQPAPAWVPTVAQPMHAPRPAVWGMPSGPTPYVAPLPQRRRGLHPAAWGALGALATGAVALAAFLIADDGPRRREPAFVERVAAPAAPAYAAPAVMEPIAPLPPVMTPVAPRPPAPVAPAESAAAVPFAAGQRWVGSYLCAQGRTRLVLRIASVRGARVEALFDFAHAASGSSGECEMRGGYEAPARHLLLRPGAWIRRPLGYIAVGMDGRVSSDGATYAGRMMHPACGAFSLRLAGT